ncbi:MAG: disulfide bond formation protein B [Neisseria sp.]|nr:disulfide bond formation protein B [Neisseria sp.]
MKSTYKKLLLLVLLIALVGSAGSFFAQYVLGLNPCPLCIFQRVAVMAVALFTIIALLFPLRFKLSRFISAVWVSLPALFGLGVALRQIYLQNLPADQVPACGPGLNFLSKTLPFTDFISTVLSGSGECAQVEKILWVPLPVWSLMLFSCILVLVWYGLFKSRHTHPYGY